MQPITRGSLKTTVASMSISDYIALGVDLLANTSASWEDRFGSFNADVSTLDELICDNGITEGFIYLMKVGKGLLLPTVKLSLSSGEEAASLYEELATVGMIGGRKVTIDGIEFEIGLPKESEALAMYTTLEHNVLVSNRFKNFANNNTSDRYEIIASNNPTVYKYFDLNTGAIATTTGTMPYRLAFRYADGTTAINL